MLARDGERSFRIGAREWKVAEFVEAMKPAGRKISEAALVPELGSSPRTAWTAVLGGRLQLVPKSGEADLTGKVFFMRNGQRLFALDLKTGKRLWTADRLGGGGVRPGGTVGAVAGPGAVVVVVGDDRLVALAPSSGKRLWEHRFAGGAAGAGRPFAGRMNPQPCMLSSGEGVVVAAPRRMEQDPRTGGWTYLSRLLVLDERTGMKLWSVPEVQSQFNNVFQAEGAVFVVYRCPARNRLVLDAYDLADGTRRFSADLSELGQSSSTSLWVRNGRLLHCGRRSLVCFDAESGKLKWRTKLVGNSWGWPLAVDDDRVLTAWSSYRRNGRRVSGLTAHDLASGKLLWKTEPVSGSIAHPGSHRYGAVVSQAPPSGNTAHAVISVQEYDRKARRHKAKYWAYDGRTGKLLWRAALPGGRGRASPPLIARKHAVGLVWGQAAVERRLWNLRSGKLVQVQKVPSHGAMVCEEGSVLQVCGGRVEKLEGSGGER
jgi:outer membrane protein assembly factor BamB